MVNCLALINSIELPLAVILTHTKACSVLPLIHAQHHPRAVVQSYRLLMRQLYILMALGFPNMRLKCSELGYKRLLASTLESGTGVS